MLKVSKDSSRITSLILLAAAVGLAYVLYMFPIAFLTGSASWWHDRAPQDVRQVVLGMRYYVADQWHFPIFKTTKINFPDGIIIIFTDCVPVLALAAKILRHALGITWNYLGAWVGAAYVLQAISMVVLLLSLGIREIVPCVAGSMLALSAPAFLFRLFHTAEIAHFLVLLALALYFFSTRSSSFRPIWLWFAGLMWLALWIEAYIFLMVWAIFLATALQFSVSSRNAWKQSVMGVAVCLAVSLGVMWVSGFFEGSGHPDGGGFGHYSMNLLSPWVPQWSAIFPRASKIFGATKSPWSESLIDATGGQYEGYNYLGAGVLLLFGIAVWLERRRFTLLAKRYWGMSLTLAGFTALALTNRIFIGTWKVTILHRVPSIFDQVRSSGRFFWPVAYLLLAGAIAAVGIRCSGWKGRAVLAGAVLLQFVDVTPVRKWVRTSAAVSGRGRASDEAWRKVIPIHDRLIILPSFSCRGDVRGEVFKTLLNLGFLASDSVTPISTTYLDRYRSPDCFEEAHEFFSRMPVDGELLVLLPPYSEAISEPPMQASVLKNCRSFRGGVACSQRWNKLSDPDLKDMFVPLSEHTQAYQLGTLIDFSEKGNSQLYNAFGWSRQGWGAWSYGNIAGLAVQLDQAGPQDLALVADAGATLVAGQPDARVDVEINDQLIQSWRLPYGERRTERRVSIPAPIASRREPLRITFYIHETEPAMDFRYYSSSVTEQPEVGFNRILGFYVRTLRIVNDAVTHGRDN